MRARHRRGPAAEPRPADTFRWRGLTAEAPGRGLTLPELRQFIDQAEEQALAAGTDPSRLVPQALLGRGAHITRIWTRISRRARRPGQRVTTRRQGA